MNKFEDTLGAFMAEQSLQQAEKITSISEAIDRAHGLQRSESLAKYRLSIFDRLASLSKCKEMTPSDIAKIAVKVSDILWSPENAISD